MKRRKGFISMSLVYSFLILFLFLMVAIISAYSQKINFLDAIDTQASKDLNTTFSTKLSLYKTIIKDNQADNLDNITSNSYILDGNGVYVIDDKDIIDEDNNDYAENEIFIYRGDVDNNYVIFGKQFNLSSTDSNYVTDIKKMCWRILRTNEDRSVRLVYFGTYSDTTNQCVASNVVTTAYNTNSNDNAYVGFTYGTAGSSTYELTHKGTNHSKIYDNLNTWVTTHTNLVNSVSKLKYTTSSGESSLTVLDNYLADEIFCNNRLTSTSNSTSGFGVTATTYVSSTKTSASYKCESVSNVINSYSLSPSLGGNLSGNNTLKYKVGLLSYDDVVLAGGNKTTSKNYFLNNGIDYWTMSPSKYDSTNGAYVYYVNASGILTEGLVSETHYILPVINLKNSVIVDSGKGTISKPYIISE